MKKEIGQKFLDKLLYIGEEIPDGVSQDRRTKFVLLGTPQALIDEIDKLFSFQKQETMDDIEKLIKSEKEKNYQRFIEILEELNEFVETESGKSGRKEILQKIQEVIKQLKDKK